MFVVFFYMTGIGIDQTTVTGNVTLVRAFNHKVKCSIQNIEKLKKIVLMQMT